jgi:hypothetical protein
MVLSLAIFGAPMFVSAQTSCNYAAASQANTSSLCAAANGTFSNTTGQCSCVPVQGTLCTVVSGVDPCQNSGMACVNGQCAQTGTGSTPAPATTNPPSSGGTQQGCPTGLSPKNGLCLPPSPYSTGIASQQTLTGVLLQVTEFLLDFAGVVAVIILVIGGFWYITSAGNEEQAEKGKKAIINAIIGLVVVILAYAIVTIISGTLITGNFLAH